MLFEITTGHIIKKTYYFKWHHNRLNERKHNEV